MTPPPLGPADYSKTPRYAGPPTFGLLPRIDEVAVVRLDGRVDVKVIGIPFDAHLDTWDTYFDAPCTHGTPFRRASEEGLLDLDPAAAQGTGTPEAGGMTSVELLNSIRGLQEINVVGAEVVEVTPAYDHTEITGLAAAHVSYEILSLWAAERGRLAGLSDPSGAVLGT